MSTDDLREVYYTFKVSRSRARRNAFRVSYPASAFRDFRAWGPSLVGQRVVPALGVMAMGDNVA
eukprot:325454-Lingulodinium_polyedra.AAC.1